MQNYNKKFGKTEKDMKMKSGENEFTIDYGLAGRFEDAVRDHFVCLVVGQHREDEKMSPHSAVVTSAES